MGKVIKVLGILLLIVVLLIAAVIGIFYYANKRMNPTIDDIEGILLSKPLEAKNRLSFSSNDETMSILIDKNDIYWYIANKYGKSLFNSIESEAKENGIVIDGYGMRIDPEGIHIDAVVGIDELDWLKINLSMLCKVERNNNTFDVVPVAIYAFGVEVKEASQFGILGTPILSFSYTPSLLEGIDSFMYVDGAIQLTGKMSVRYCGMARDGFSPDELEKMKDDDRCNYAVQILQKYNEDPTEGKKLWMSILEDNPELFPTVYKQMLSVIKRSSWANYYVEMDNDGFIYRVVPDYDVDLFKEISDNLHQQYGNNS